MANHNGKQGGLLKGKRHYDKSGKPLGGIKAIVTDTGQQVELEGGEVIINREASKKHWKELSRINQSAGGGVPILPPDTVEADTEEYRRGGTMVEFNPNILPSKWVYDYAKKVKEKYPKVWEQYANVYGNEAFENLGGALKRGYWLDKEEWFYYKWKAFNTKHKASSSLKDVLASLKWCNVNRKGWDYMKSVIAEEIKKQYPKAEKLAKGKKIKEEVKAKTYKEWVALMKKDNNEHNRNAHEDDVIPFWEWVSEMGAMYGFKPVRDSGGDTIIVRTHDNPPNKEEVLAYIEANKGVYADDDGDLDESDEERLAEDVAEHFNIEVFDAYDYIDEPKMKLGGKTPILTPESKKHLAPTFIADSNLVEAVFPTNTNTTEMNGILRAIGLPFKVTDDIGNGAFGTAFLTDRGTVLKITDLANEAYGSYVISKSNFKSQAKVYNVFKITDGAKNLFFIEKELVKVARDIAYKEEFPFGRVFGEAFSTGSSRIKASFTNKELVIRAKDFYEEWLEELANMIKTKEVHKQVDLDGVKEFKARKKYVVKKIYNLFVFYRDLEKETETKKGIRFNDVHTGNFGEVGKKFVCFDCISGSPISEQKSFMVGGELAKGIEVENEHKGTLEKLYKHQISLRQAPKHIAKDHLKEDKKYYTKLAELESKFAGGGGIDGLKVGDTGTYAKRKVEVVKLAKGGADLKDISSGEVIFRKFSSMKKRWVADGGNQEPNEEPKTKGGDLTDVEERLLLSIAESMSQDNFSEFTIKKGKKFTPLQQEALDSLLAKGLIFNTYDDDIYDLDMYCVTCEGKKVAEGLGWDSSDVEWYGGCEEEEKPKVEPKVEPKIVTPENLPDVNYALETPTGEPSKLTYLQQILVRTEAFKKFFGDWEASAKQYIANPVGGFNTFYRGVSKNIDLITLEPRIMYHGTMTKEEFFVFEANRSDVARPYAYFSRNKVYAENFTTSSQRRSGDKPFMYECFLGVKVPFMAVGNQYEIVKANSDYWLDQITSTLLFDKKGGTKEDMPKTYSEIYEVVESQVGRYVKSVCADEKMQFWKFMARDKKSEFKAFLMSHDYDGIEYGEELNAGFDINNPSEYTMATTIFDSRQIKLADGRNLDFNKENPDIRYEDGGNLHNSVVVEQTPINESVPTKKDKLGKVLFGDKYEVKELGGEVAKPLIVDEDKAYVEDLITKMKE